MASNTGCTSVGELAITFRISAVAVCRSSASWVSLNSRTFSIAITAWSAKVCSSCDVAGRRTAGLGARDADHADRLAVRAAAARTTMLRKPRARAISRSVGRPVGLACRRSCDDRAVADASPPGSRIRQRLRERRRSAASAAGLVGVNAAQVHRRRRTRVDRRDSRRPAGSRSRDRVEHRLHVVGRAGDDLQDLGRRGLPLERLLGLVEQAHVLDRDHGLVGEGLQQLDVVVGENAPGSRRVQASMPIDLPWRIMGVNVTLRKPRARPIAASARSAVSTSVICAVSPSAPRRRAAARSDACGNAAVKGFVGLRRGRRERRQVHDVVDDAKTAVETAEQPVGARRDGLEHRLHVRRRTGDDLEDLGRRRLPLERLLGLVEQPRVLDRDHGLVGEGFGERDFVLAEDVGVFANNANKPIHVPMRCNGRIQRMNWAVRLMDAALECGQLDGDQSGKCSVFLRHDCARGESWRGVDRRLRCRVLNRLQYPPGPCRRYLQAGSSQRQRTLNRSGSVARRSARWRRIPVARRSATR